jgi:4-amino-4-deoxy-L-arabinose transferase-like glycosyltransferase
MCRLVSSSTTRRSPLPRVAVAVFLLFCLALGAALLAPLTTYPLGRDQGVFATVADVISRGGALYKDAWDIKPPGVFYIFWLSFRAFGRSEAAPRVFDLLWTLATAITVWAIGRRLFSEWAAIAAAFFFLIRYITHDYYWHTTQCDGFVSLPLALAALTLAAEDRKSRGLAAACGALIAVAIIFKSTLGIFIALPLAAAFASRRESLRPRIARAAWYLAGCAIVLLAAAGLIWKAGALGQMVDIVIRWNAAYARMQVPGLPHQSLASQLAKAFIGQPAALIFPIGLLALVGATDLCFRPGSTRVRWLVPAWALVVVLQVWIQGRYYSYHWLPLLPPLALLAGQGLRTLSVALRKSLRPRPAAALSALGLVALFAMLGTGYYSFLRFPLRYMAGQVPRATYLRAFDRAIVSDFSLTADQEVAAWIRQRIRPNTPFYIWGFEPLIYFLADRPPASRFIYNIPLVASWSPAEWRAELVRDLQEKSTRYILVVHRDPQPWMVGRWDDSASQLATYPELAQLLRDRYRLCEQIQDFDIYEREAASESTAAHSAARPQSPM